MGEVVSGQGVSRRSALNWFHAGTVPVPARQLPTCACPNAPTRAASAGSRWTAIGAPPVDLAALVGGAVVAASCVVTARWQPTSDPHPAGNGYCHGKTARVNARTARHGLKTQSHMFLNGPQGIRL